MVERFSLAKACQLTGFEELISTRSTRKDEAWYIVKILEAVKERNCTRSELGRILNADFWSKAHRSAYDAFQFCAKNFLLESSGIYSVNQAGLDYLRIVHSQVSYEPTGTVEWKELFAEVA